MAKKKTQLKKVDRGFATTSTPKKVVPEPTAEPETEPQAEQAVSTNDANDANSLSTATVEAEKVEYDPAAIEEQELQALAEKVKPAAHREITRLIKVRQLLSLRSRKSR